MARQISHISDVTLCEPFCGLSRTQIFWTTIWCYLFSSCNLWMTSTWNAYTCLVNFSTSKTSRKSWFRSLRITHVGLRKTTFKAGSASIKQLKILINYYITYKNIGAKSYFFLKFSFLRLYYFSLFLSSSCRPLRAFSLSALIFGEFLPTFYLPFTSESSENLAFG